MATIATTRTELLTKKIQITLAEQGRELLKQKRTALLHELMRVADRVMAARDALEAMAAESRRALARAEAVAGAEAVRSAAMAARQELALDVQASNVMGIRVPVIEQKRVTRSVFGRGYALPGTSVAIDETAAAFESEVDSVIALAQSELRLTHLVNEIQRTSRRVNALEHVIIPRLIEERRFIQLALDERERADRFRLKRVKSILGQKREA